MSGHVPSRQTFQAYHHSAGLLCQFLLSEYIEIGQPLEEISDLYETLEPHLLEAAREKRPIDRLFSKKRLTQLLQIANYLCPDPIEKEAFTFVASSGGVCAKFRDFALLFDRLFATDEIPRSLVRDAVRLYQTMIDCHFALRSFQEGSTRSVKDIEAKKLVTHIKKMLRLNKRIAKYLAQIIEGFRDDETVMLFLIQHHERLGSVMGHKILIGVMQRMFPQGSGELTSFLKKRYGSRGFTHLFDVIDEKVEEVAAYAIQE